mmetsp:Transcript_72947/g.84630  ORF Transcript_72947/g.84630 Transcript_72947/m.84630 type:complete len:258 (+) Transcript_72947:55-828(+)
MDNQLAKMTKLELSSQVCQKTKRRASEIPQLFTSGVNILETDHCAGTGEIAQILTDRNDSNNNTIERAQSCRGLKGKPIIPRGIKFEAWYHKINENIRHGHSYQPLNLAKKLVLPLLSDRFRSHSPRSKINALINDLSPKTALDSTTESAKSTPRKPTTKAFSDAVETPKKLKSPAQRPIVLFKILRKPLNPSGSQSSPERSPSNKPQTPDSKTIKISIDVTAAGSATPILKKSNFCLDSSLFAKKKQKKVKFIDDL